MADQYSFEGKIKDSIKSEAPLVFMFQPHTFEVVEDDPEVLEAWERETAERCGARLTELKSRGGGCTRSFSICNGPGWDDSDCVDL